MGRAYTTGMPHKTLKQLYDIAQTNNRIAIAFALQYEQCPRYTLFYQKSSMVGYT